VRPVQPGHKGEEENMSSKQDVLAQVRDKKIELIRFVYIDNDGVIRSYATTPSELESDLESGHPYSIAMPFFSVLDDLVPGTRFGCVGELAAVPDLNTFRVLPYAPGQAMVICEFRNKTDHSPSGLCARAALNHFLTSVDYEVKAAFENEFYLLRKQEDGTYLPYDHSLCFATRGMNEQYEVVMDMVKALQAQELVVEKYYPEYGRGQVEVVCKYRDALGSADDQIIFRETMRGVAHKHGLVATFMPKPFQDLAGSGAHMHLSLWKKGQNLFHDPADKNGLSQEAKHFIGGLLKHLPALCAFTASTVNSYKRLIPHAWASAFVCYGRDNREAAIRLVTPMKGWGSSSFNLEFKPTDPACNPYLALLTVLAAGLEGIRNRTEPGEPVEGDPYELDQQERQRRGIKRLPQTLGEAIMELEADDLFKEVLGEVFLDEYIKLKRFAWTQYIQHVSDWETATYTEAF
jgi:glutamine synthetase